MKSSRSVMEQPDLFRFEKPKVFQNKSQATIPEFNLQLFNEDYSDMSNKSLLSSLKKHKKKLHEHINKVNDPEKYAKNWNDINQEHKEGLINYWNKEIKNFKQLIDDAEVEKKKRGI